MQREMDEMLHSSHVWSCFHIQQSAAFLVFSSSCVVSSSLVVCVYCFSVEFHVFSEVFFITFSWFPLLFLRSVFPCLNVLHLSVEWSPPSLCLCPCSPLSVLKIVMCHIWHFSLCFVHFLCPLCCWILVLDCTVFFSLAWLDKLHWTGLIPRFWPLYCSWLWQNIHCF